MRSSFVRLLELALFVIAFAVAGLVVLALLWSGTGPYADLARDNHVERVEFIGRDGRAHLVGLPAVVDIHRRWSAYVTGGTSDPPTFEDDVRFTDDEYSHMADVRGVFGGARLLVPLGLVVIIVRLQRARLRSPREMWLLVRNGAGIAAVAVLLVGALAVVAFEPLFLAFHYVFFPQGNFLFDPATSDLVRLYPDWYWEGITLRVGASFIALAIALTGLATWRLRAAK